MQIIVATEKRPTIQNGSALIFPVSEKPIHVRLFLTLNTSFSCQQILTRKIISEASKNTMSIESDLKSLKIFTICEICPVNHLKSEKIGVAKAVSSLLVS